MPSSNSARICLMPFSNSAASLWVRCRLTAQTRHSQAAVLPPTALATAESTSQAIARKACSAYGQICQKLCSSLAPNDICQEQHPWYFKGRMMLAAQQESTKRDGVLLPFKLVLSCCLMFKLLSQVLAANCPHAIEVCASNKGGEEPCKCPVWHELFRLRQGCRTKSWPRHQSLLPTSVLSCTDCMNPAPFSHQEHHTDAPVYSGLVAGCLPDKARPGGLFVLDPPETPAVPGTVLKLSPELGQLTV